MHIRSFAAITVISAALGAGMLAASPAALAQEPTIHQVYQAAEAGKFIEAQALMDQVLAAHPNSAKAHFVEAELLAKQGKFERAATELASAERLGPDLKFAKPEALQRLKATIAQARPAASKPVSLGGADALQTAPARVPAERALPWGLLLGVGALVLLAVMFFKRKAGQRMSNPGWNAGPASMGSMGGMPSGGYGQGGYPSGGMPQSGGMPGMGGLGSGIVGGLATGAAVGAGMVAGQALAHHFTDGDRNNHDGARGLDSGLTGGAFPQNDTPPSGYDMGGADFGVSDAGSWDSGDSGGGGGDWD